MNKEKILKEIKETDEELINTIREQCMYDYDLAKFHLKNHGLTRLLKANKEDLKIEKERLDSMKRDWKEIQELNKKKRRRKNERRNDFN